MSFLPSDYVAPTTSTGSYFKPTEAKTKIRIVSSPITGWIDWNKSWEKPQPVRTKEKKTALDPQKAPKHFWAMKVWNYEKEQLQIREVTQASVRDQILAYNNDADWGDPKEYDISVAKTGKDLETKYTVLTTSSGKKALDENIVEKVKTTKCVLEALFSWEDPFTADEVF